MKLSFSNGIFSKLSLEENLSAVKWLGFANIEFNMKSVEKQTDDSTEPAENLISRYRFNCLTVHSASLHVQDESEVPTAIYYGKVSTDFAHALSAPVMTIHSNVARKLPEKQRTKILKVIFGELNPYAKRLGVRLALENLSYASSGYGKNVAEMEEILDAIDPDGVMGITIDFCHSLATGTTESLLEKYHSRLCNVHMSNRAHQPFKQQTPNLVSFLKRLHEYQYSGPLTMELRRKCTFEEIQRTKVVLEKLLLYC